MGGGWYCHNDLMTLKIKDKKDEASLAASLQRHSFRWLSPNRRRRAGGKDERVS